MDNHGANRLQLLPVACMAVNPPTLSPPLPVPGFRIGTASCGVKSPELRGRRHDLMLLVADNNCHAAGVFTQNRLRAACVSLGEETIASHSGSIRAIIANSGNANAGTGKMERDWAGEMIAAAAVATGSEPHHILSASTGVIGQPFPIERIRKGMKEAVQHLSEAGWERAAKAICTTDTFAKWASRRIGNYTITGICKGSGMIHPNMATMLSFIATDAPLSHQQLQSALQKAVNRSFNSISVDGDTSTNDTVYLLAPSQEPGHAIATETVEFEKTLTDLCVELAQMIVRDGEGVSKFVTIQVTEGRNEDEARRVGRAIAVSPLVKTAFAGSDANWGRILCAIGNSGVAVQPETISLSVDQIPILAGGNLHPDYREENGMRAFAKDEFSLQVGLGLGNATATVWTGDLTHEYIRINAEYRT